jgi:invasion protein IalB
MEVCYTYVDIRDPPTGIRIGSIGVLQAEALKRTVLIGLFPLHATAMPEPGYLLLQDGTRIKFTSLPGSPCGALGCFARADLSESLLSRIKAAQTLSFGIEDVISGRPVSTPLACCGFAEAVAGAPVDANAYDATQLWITKYLRQTLPVFIQ